MGTGGPRPPNAAAATIAEAASKGDADPAGDAATCGDRPKRGR